MIVDCIVDSSIDGVAAASRRFAAAGYDGIWCAETVENPMLSLVLCAEHAPGLELMTAVSVAFARTPMALAYDAVAIERLSPGVLTVGLGSQIPQHITKRFGMPWSEPIARMSDYLAAMRAIWRSWTTGERLNHRGRFYRHTFMPPFNTPIIGRESALRLTLAAVGPRMMELAGAEADGVVLHAIATPRYLEECAFPAIRRGYQSAGKHRADHEVSMRPMIASGLTDDDRRTQFEEIRAEVAFTLASPSYATFIEIEELEGLHRTLRRIALTGDWHRMMAEVPDEVVHQLAVVAPASELAQALQDRFGTALDRICIQMPRSAVHADEIAEWRSVIDQIREIPTGRSPVPDGTSVARGAPKPDA